MNLSASQQNAFQEAGFLLVERLISADALDPLRSEADRLLREASERGGVRNVLHKSEALRQLADSGPPGQLARSLLGGSVRPTKLTVFDKTPQANWKVPWHQDLTIAVNERRNIPGFGPWSVKDGVVHVQPPASVLAQILAIRLHLDDTSLDNGALRVLPGTHTLGRIAGADVPSLRQRIAEQVCAVPAGGALLMRPLLLHASSASERPSRRRVLHFEYSATPLAEDLTWA